MLRALSSRAQVTLVVRELVVVVVVVAAAGGVARDVRKV